jgi:hypothetical protein
MDEASYGEAFAQLIKVHEYVKELMLLAEEIGDQFSAYNQPRLEQAHAYEHLTRVLAVQHGIQQPPNEGFVRKELGSVLRHECRAFCDAADYFAILVREKLCDLMKPFDNETVETVFPKYYTELRTEVTRISVEIAQVRGNKDTADRQVVFSDIETYRQKIERLREILDIVMTNQPGLWEHRKKRGRGRRIELLIGVLLGVLLAFLGKIIDALH